MKYLVWNSLSFSFFTNAVSEKSQWTYYVSAEGSDAFGGKSIVDAFASIQHAVDVAEDDAEILVGDGVYGAVSVGAKRLKIRSLNGASQTVIDLL